MIVMGIDASTSATGWGVFDGDNLIAHGLIKPKGDDWQDRVKQEWPLLCNIIEKYAPERIYIEDVPLIQDKKKGKGPKTLLMLGAVQGMILGVSAYKNIPVEFLSPSEWRGALGLYDGTREGTQREVLKKKAIEMVNKKFGLDLLWVAPKSKRNQDDEAEGILVAYSQVKKRFIGKTHN